MKTLIGLAFINEDVLKFIQKESKYAFPKLSRPYLYVEVENQTNLFHLIPLKSIGEEVDETNALDFSGSFLLRAGQFQKVVDIQNINKFDYLMNQQNWIINASKRHINTASSKKINNIVNWRELIQKTDNYSNIKRNTLIKEKRFLGNIEFVEQEIKQDKRTTVNKNKIFLEEKKEIYQEIRVSDNFED